MCLRPSVGCIFICFLVSATHLLHAQRSGTTVSSDGALQAVAFSGRNNGDIHDRANAAIATCQVSNAEHPHGCNVHIGVAPVPYACWPVSTTLNVPISVNGSVAIYWDNGACEDFYGGGPAVNIAGGALPNIGVHLINPKINGVQDEAHLGSPNTRSPGGILIGHWEGVVIDNPNITNFRAGPEQLSTPAKAAKQGACGICVFGTDGLYVNSGNLEGNWDNLTLGVGDGYGANNGAYDFHSSGAVHRNINAEAIGTGNVIHVAADPPTPGAEEVIGFFGQGFGNVLDVRYSEGALGEQGGYTPPNGVRGLYGLVVAGGELHISNYQSGLTRMTASILVDNGASVYVDFASDGDDRSGAFFDFGPNLGKGRPGYFHIAGFYGFTALGPGHNPRNLPCSAIVHEPPFFNARNSGGALDTTCAAMQVEPYWHQWVTGGFTAPDAAGIRFHKPAVGTLPTHNAVTTWGASKGDEFGGAYDDTFEYTRMKRTGTDPGPRDHSTEVPTTRWVDEYFVRKGGKESEPTGNVPAASQLLSFGTVSTPGGGPTATAPLCFGLNGMPSVFVALPQITSDMAGTPMPAGHTMNVSDLAFAIERDPGAGVTVTVALRDNDADTSLGCAVTGTGRGGANLACNASGSFMLGGGHRGSWCVTSTAPTTSPNAYRGSAVGILR